MKLPTKSISKKAISLIIAVALILSCVAVSFSTFAAQKKFNVPSSSPAVPLYVNKAIELSELSVEIDGTTKSGDLLSWEVVSGNSAEVKNGFIVGNRTGITKFAVKDDLITQNVYVIVNARGNSKFYLVDLDFNEGDYNEDDWISGMAYLNSDGDYVGNGWNNGANQYGIYSNGKYKVKYIGLTTEKVSVGGELKTALKIPAPTVRFSNAAAFYKNDALNDFADVSINANMSYACTDGNGVGPISAAGLFARVKLGGGDYNTDDQILADIDKSYAFRFRAYGGLTVNSINGANISLFQAGRSSNNWETTTIARGQGYVWYTAATPERVLDGTTALREDTADKNLIFYPDAYDAETLTNREVNITLDGKGIKYDMNGTNILDTSIKIDGYTLDYTVGNAPFKYTADNISLNRYQNWDGNINVYGGGTIAFNNNNAADSDLLGAFSGCDLYVYNVTVEPENIKNAEELPAMTDFGGGETYENIPINTRMDLSQIDADVVWNDVRTAQYEIKNGMLLAYSGAGTSITLSGIKDEVEFNKTISIVEKGGFSDYNTKKFADDQMTVIPDLNDGTKYQVKVSRNYAVVYGTFKVTANGLAQTIYDDIGDGCTYAFNTALADKMVITAQYTSNEKAVKSISVLQAWVRQGDAQTHTTDAIRFQTKIPALVWDGVSTNPKNIKFCTDKIEVGGKEVTLESVGTLIMPEVLLGDNDLAVGNDVINSFNPVTDKSLYINGYLAANIPIVNLCNATETYCEAYATVGNLTTVLGVDAHEIELTAVSYIQYADDEGNKGYIYSAPYTESYNGVINSAYKFDEKSATLEKLFVANGLGTDHDIDSSLTTTNISYGLDENITFFCEVQGNYTIEWALYKDNPAANAIAEFGEKVVKPNQIAQTNTPVLTGSSMHKVAVTTKMKEAGTLKLICNIKDSTGRQVMYGGGNATVIIAAAADYANIKQPLEISGNKPTSYKDKSGATVNMTTDGFIEFMQNKFDERMDVVGSRIDEEKTEIINFINNANQGDSYEIDKTFRLYCASANGVYRYFDFIFGVDDTVGLTTTNASTNLFTDTCYQTASTQTGLPQYNLRPATGCVCIPYDTASITKFKSFYIGYGGHAGNRSGGTAGTFYLMTNAHGYDNTLYYTNNVFTILKSQYVNAGGVADCIMGSAEGGITDPTQSYAYGMLFRDYIALKVGEKLHDYLTNGKAITDFTVTGSSMGAFQAHFMTALEKKVTYIEGMIPWMTTVGQETTDNILSTFMPKNNTAVHYFSTVSAAQYCVKTMNERPKNYRVKVSGGLADPTAPISGTLALFNVYKDAPCERWLAISQFQLHGGYPFSWGSEFDHVTQVKNY